MQITSTEKWTNNYASKIDARMQTHKYARHICKNETIRQENATTGTLLLLDHAN